MAHRKSATVASPPNKHPSRMSPATPFRHQPRFQISKRGSSGRRGRACSGSTWSSGWASRFLPWLSSECVTALRAQRAQQVADRKSAGDNWKGTGHGLVFTTKNGTPIEPRNLNRSFETLSIRAGIRKVRFHDLRHTCASLLHEQGADARMIMEVLGPSSIRVTMDIYTFVRLDAQRSASDRVGDALRSDGNDGEDDDGAAGVLVAV
ncbi:integrase [Streptomyces sviceus ATCC 29083]|uniref:Integrase n=1 Tax=Streptomyces sviceus (strain ATCC 29083 / DSM 924 / JCM 4929 / NBRC 13980 / NCIMB 11184 / NRRL 5439 / UC 5370) TaxID=463191 RepID=B5HUB2_STRX2|nr:integrase [Streptomyces sviceus ATCC 29083]